LPALLSSSRSPSRRCSRTTRSPAEFDAKRPVKLRGTVVKMEWINPHSWIHIDVKDPQTGKVERWMIEGGAPNALLRRGWTKNSLPEGTEILVEGFQAKDGANRANGRDITFPDGKKLFVGSLWHGARLTRDQRSRGLIGSRTLGLIDHQHIDRAARRFQLQPELLLQAR
jgi:hypothetical protein